MYHHCIFVSVGYTFSVLTPFNALVFALVDLVKLYVDFLFILIISGTYLTTFVSSFVLIF